MEPGEHDVSDERRRFLKFAAITPPAVTFLLSTTLSSKAIAASGGTAGPRPGHGWGDKNHDHGGPPGLARKSGAAARHGARGLGSRMARGRRG